MIKAILFLSALNIALLPVIYLLHVNAVDGSTQCSVAAYLKAGDFPSRFENCSSRSRVYFVSPEGGNPETALRMDGNNQTAASN
jgi:hypothetical protein